MSAAPELGECILMRLDLIALGPNPCRERPPTLGETEDFARTMAKNRWVAPLLVRLNDDARRTGWVISGEKRLRALQFLEKHEKIEWLPRDEATRVLLVPVQIRKCNYREALLLNAAENAARVELSAWELISTCARLHYSFGLPLDAIAVRLNRSASAVKRFAQIQMRVAPEILAALRNGADIPLTRLYRWAALPHEQQLSEWRGLPNPHRVWEGHYVRSRAEIAAALAELEKRTYDRSGIGDAQEPAAWLRWVLREGEKPT